MKYLLPAALKDSASSIGVGLGLVGFDLWGGTGGAEPPFVCFVPFVMGTEKADCGWGCACWGGEDVDGLEGGSTSMALGSLMLESAERRFLSSGGRLRGWVSGTVRLRREEWPGSVEWRTKVREDLGLCSLRAADDGWDEDFLLLDEPDAGLDEPLLEGDFVGEGASDGRWWSESPSCAAGWFRDDVLKSFFIPG